MKNIIKATFKNIPEIVDLWYEVSIQAHSFISQEYWKANIQLMKKKYVPMSETYLFVDKGIILGFISLVDDYLAAIFVKSKNQGNGIGSSLIKYAKDHRTKLQLKVFCKNKKSIEFYQSKVFSIISQSKDEETGENEFVMQWHKSL